MTRSPFKLMSYNVQDLFLEPAFALHQDHLHALSDPHWALLARPDQELKPLSKLKQIAAIIRQEAPDCVCLCDVGGMTALANFNDYFLGGAYRPYLSAGSSERGIENGFLLKRELPLRGQLMSHRDWPVPFRYAHEQEPEGYGVSQLIAEGLKLEAPHERRLSRDIAVLELHAADNRCLLSVVLVHLKSGFDPYGLDPGGQRRRAAEVRALIAIYHKIRAEHGEAHPVMVAGDFNGNASREDTAPEFLPLYADTDLEDALYLAGVPRAERHTHVTFFGRNTRARQLDYVFLNRPLRKRLVLGGTHIHRYRPPAGGQELMEPWSFRDRDLLPSDHYPVVCTVVL